MGRRRRERSLSKLRQIDQSTPRAKLPDAWSIIFWCTAATSFGVVTEAVTGTQDLAAVTLGGASIGLFHYFVDRYGVSTWAATIMSPFIAIMSISLVGGYASSPEHIEKVLFVCIDWMLPGLAVVNACQDFLKFAASFRVLKMSLFSLGASRFCWGHVRSVVVSAVIIAISSDCALKIGSIYHGSVEIVHPVEPMFGHWTIRSLSFVVLVCSWSALLDVPFSIWILTVSIGTVSRCVLPIFHFVASELNYASPGWEWLSMFCCSFFSSYLASMLCHRSGGGSEIFRKYHGKYSVVQTTQENWTVTTLTRPMLCLYAPGSTAVRAVLAFWRGESLNYVLSLVFETVLTGFALAAGLSCGTHF